MHEVLVNCVRGLSLSRKSVVRLTDRPDMTLDVYSGGKTTTHHWEIHKNWLDYCDFDPIFKVTGSKKVENALSAVFSKG